MTKRILSILTAVMLFCSMAVPIASAEETPSKTVYTFGDFQYKIRKNQTVKLVKFIGDPNIKKLKIPAKIDGMPVTALGNEVGWGLQIESLQLSNTLKEINGSFFNCDQLQSVVIPNSVTKITDAFSACDNLEEVTLSKNLKTLRQGFNDCPKLKELHLPAKLKTIDSGLLHRSPKAKLTLAKKNPYLKKSGPAILADNGKTLAWWARAKKTDTYRVPSTVKTIKAGVFSSADVKRIVLPTGLKSIEEDAFSGCPAKVNIPDTVKTIGAFAFASSGIRSAVIRKDTKIGYMAFWGSEIRSVAFESGAVIPTYAFMECLKLKTVRIAKNVTVMPDAFGIRDDDYGYAHIEGIQVYGYLGSEANTYATTYCHDFILLTSLKKAKVKNVKAVKYTKSVKKYGAKQSVKVYVKGKRLKKGRDYTLSYKNNKKRGKATVIITGINKYDGVIKRTFNIK